MELCDILSEFLDDKPFMTMLLIVVLALVIGKDKAANAAASV